VYVSFLTPDSQAPSDACTSFPTTSGRCRLSKGSIRRSGDTTEVVVKRTAEKRCWMENLVQEVQKQQVA